MDVMAQPAAAPEVSIVIPTWSSVEELLKCLKALGANTQGISYELIVVDNGSIDATAKVLAQLPFVKAIRNSENLGFARACNQGAAMARAPLLVFLNDDTEPQPNWLAPLVAAFRHDAKIGLASAKLVHRDTRIEQAGYSLAYASPYPLTPLPQFRRQPFAALVKTRTFAAVTASCLLVRASLYRTLGGFDEGFINGMEDVDLCLRAFRHGLSSVVVAESVVLHEPRFPAERTAFAKHNIERLNQRWNTYEDRWGCDFRKFSNLRPQFPKREPVSVVVVAKDALASGAACVEHVLAHAQSDDEVILVEDETSAAFSHWAKMRLQSEKRLRRLVAHPNESYAQSACIGLMAARHKLAAALPCSMRPDAHWLDGASDPREADGPSKLFVFPTHMGAPVRALGPYEPPRPHDANKDDHATLSTACLGERQRMLVAFNALAASARPASWLSQPQLGRPSTQRAGAVVYPFAACDGLAPIPPDQDLSPNINGQLAVLVRVHNQEEAIRRCLQQLFTWGLSPSNVWLLHVPQAGKAPVNLAQVAASPEIHMVTIADSSRLSAAVNSIIGELNVPFFAVIDDHLHIPSACALTLLDHLVSQPKLALAGPLLNVFKGAQASEQAVDASRVEEFALAVAWQSRGQFRNTMHLDSHCVFGQKRAVMSVNALDTAFSMIDYAVDDLVARLRFYGFASQVALDAYAHFVEEQDSSGGSKESLSNRAQLIEKWKLRRAPNGLLEVSALLRQNTDTDRQSPTQAVSL